MKTFEKHSGSGGSSGANDLTRSDTLITSGLTSSQLAAAGASASGGGGARRDNATAKGDTHGITSARYLETVVARVFYHDLPVRRRT